MKPTAKLWKPLIVTRILPKDRCLEVSKILCKVDHLDSNLAVVWRRASPVIKIPISLFWKQFFLYGFQRNPSLVVK